MMMKLGLVIGCLALVTIQGHIVRQFDQDSTATEPDQIFNPDPYSEYEAESYLDDAVSDVDDIGSDVEDTGSDLEDTGSDVDDTGSDVHDAGRDVYDTGTDVYDTGSDVEDMASNVDDTGSDAEDTGSDVDDAGSDVDEAGDTAAGPARKCSCLPYGCYCHARAFGVTVAITLSLQEAERCDKPMVVASFHINSNIRFAVLFPIDRLETYCHSVGGVQYCFRINVNKYYETKKDVLYGCVNIIKPAPMTIGCFRLPKLNMVSIVDEDCPDEATVTTYYDVDGDDWSII